MHSESCRFRGLSDEAWHDVTRKLGFDAVRPDGCQRCADLHEPRRRQHGVTKQICDVMMARLGLMHGVLCRAAMTRYPDIMAFFAQRWGWRLRSCLEYEAFCLDHTFEMCGIPIVMTAKYSTGLSSVEFNYEHAGKSWHVIFFIDDQMYDEPVGFTRHWMIEVDGHEAVFWEPWAFWEPWDVTAGSRDVMDLPELHDMYDMVLSALRGLF